VIRGIGLDIVDIARVERLLEGKGDRALRRLFTPAEAAYATAHAFPARHFAARIAAKEAAFKALAGTEFARGIGWCEIEVVHIDEGRPALLFHGRAETRARELGVRSVWVSLTHEKMVAAAVVVLEG
jgi:holo-[acyl-carrier protein] synthase